ncbi:MAG: hypothetical protein PHC70_02510, partial [Patescibacteria group bacterium]|nr:hypothetical protein [Patescibacteria group bacterium]
AIYSLQPDLLDGVTDQELLAAIVGLDMKSLTSKLGEYGHVREIEPLREKAGSLIHDQRIIEKLAETGPRDVREGAALLLDDPDCWILGSAEMDIAQVEAWAEKFSVWDTGLVNRLAQDTKLLYNHGMFRAFKLSGKLTQEAYKAIVEKYEAITPLNGISLWPFLREIEDREFVAGKIKKWADDPTRATTAPAIVKLVGQCGGEIKAAADAHQPLDPKIAFVLEQSAKLPDYLREVSERAVDLLRHAQAV